MKTLTPQTNTNAGDSSRFSPKTLMLALFGAATINVTGAYMDDHPFNPETGKYENQNPEVVPDNSKLGEILKRYLFEEVIDKEPESVPLQQVDPTQLVNVESKTADAALAFNGPSPTRVTRLGHSTVLIEIEKQVWLTDPVFSERASPVQWMGPKRFHPVPMEVDKLAKINGVLISHNHYDHLDKDTIKSLHERTEHFLVPEGIKPILLDWGVAEEKIQEFTWWDEVQIGKVKFVSTPAQHFSGRGLFDSNETLWTSWVIAGKEHRIFFSGDTGYFDGFKDIGDRFGPFDITLMETGAYDPLWSDIHMAPEESLQAHLDLKGKMILPIHNSTFDLAMHSWYDPMERLEHAAHSHHTELATPLIGEPIVLGEPRNNIAWWKEYKSEAYVLNHHEDGALESGAANASP